MVDLMTNALRNHFIDKHTINHNTTIYTVCHCYGLATVTKSWVNLSLNTRCSLSLQEKKNKNRREPGNFASKAVDPWHMIIHVIKKGQTMSITIIQFCSRHPLASSRLKTLLTSKLGRLIFASC